MEDLVVDEAGIQTAFDEVLDQAFVFHSFADYLRDYDIFIYVTTDPRPEIAPQHLRYRFKYCVRVVAVSAVAPQVWRESLDDRLIDYGQGRDLDGYVWGVKWQNLYPGMRLVTESASADHWSRSLGIPFYEAAIETRRGAWWWASQAAAGVAGNGWLRVQRPPAQINSTRPGTRHGQEHWICRDPRVATRRLPLRLPSAAAEQRALRRIGPPPRGQPFSHWAGLHLVGRHTEVASDLGI